jgi:hypothetical protein
LAHHPNRRIWGRFFKASVYENHQISFKFLNGYYPKIAKEKM